MPTRRFYARLLEDDYCYVLAPVHTGKTSLMAHTAVRLRGDGIRVATVDLAQISGRDSTDDVGRWYYSIAYRIIRELRIRSDMQTWWQEHSGLTNMQRLREFFLEVVLENTEERVVIFIDRIEAVVGRPFARELLAAVRACYDARAMEPEYQRLTFRNAGLCEHRPDFRHRRSRFALRYQYGNRSWTDFRHRPSCDNSSADWAAIKMIGESDIRAHLDLDAWPPLSQSENSCEGLARQV